MALRFKKIFVIIKPTDLLALENLTDSKLNGSHKKRFVRAVQH